MGWMDEIAGALAGAAPRQQFEHAADNAPAHELQAGLAHAMRSDETPPFGDIVGQLFSHSPPDQKAGILNRIVAALGPEALAAILSGSIGRTLTRESPQVTADEAARVDPGVASEAAARAEKELPGIVDEVAGFYAQHSQLIKTLGGAAMAIALARMKQTAPR